MNNKLTYNPDIYNGCIGMLANISMCLKEKEIEKTTKSYPRKNIFKNKTERLYKLTTISKHNYQGIVDAQFKKQQ